MSTPCRPKVAISGGFLLLSAWFVYANGYQPFLLLLLASLLHEGGHLLALRCFGARVSAFRLTVFGAVLETESRRLSYLRELTAVLAGPCANLACGALLAACGQAWPALYRFAGAQFLLGAFNLLPVRPLDGGRAVELLTAFFLGPDAGERAASCSSCVCGLAASAAAAALMLATGGSLWLLPAAAGLAAAAFPGRSR